MYIKIQHSDNVYNVYHLVLLIQKLNLLMSKQQNNRGELLAMQSDQ